jgi:hypothetical protein
MDSALTLCVVRSRKRLIIDDALPSGGGAQDNPSSLGHAAATTSLAVLLAQGLVPEQAGEFGVTFSFAEEAAARSWVVKAKRPAYSPIWSYRKGAHPRNRARPRN